MGNIRWVGFHTFLTFATLVSLGLSACDLQSNGVGFTGVDQPIPAPDKTGSGGGGDYNTTDWWDPSTFLPATPYLHMECQHDSSSKSDYRVTLTSTIDTSKFTATVYETAPNAKEKIIYQGEVRSRLSANKEGHLNFGSTTDVPSFYLRVLDPSSHENPLDDPDTQFGYFAKGRGDGLPNLSRTVSCDAEWHATFDVN